MKKYDARISYLDLLGELVRRWKTLLIAVLIGIFVFNLYANYSYRKSKPLGAPSSQVSAQEYEDTVKNAKAALSETEIKLVEAIFQQYLLYMENRSIAQDYYNKASIRFEDPDSVLKVLKYCVVSDIKGIESCFSELALTGEEYEEILHLGNEQKDGYENLILISNAFSNEPDEASIDERYRVYADSDQYMFTVNIIAASEEACDKISEVIDAAFQRESENLNREGIPVELIDLGSSYGKEAKQFLNDKRITRLGDLVYSDTAITNLRLYHIEKLTEDQKELFDLMEREYQYSSGGSAAEVSSDAAESTSVSEEQTSAPKTSGKRVIISKKYTLIGFVLGLLIAVVLIWFIYITNGTIKSEAELETNFRLQILNSIPVRGEKTHLFDGLVWRLRGYRKSDLDMEPINEKLTAADLDILLKTKGMEKVYFAYDGEAAEKAARQMCAAPENASRQISVGSLLSDARELRSLADTDGVVLFISARKTLQGSVDKIVQICNRYEKELLGAVFMITI